MIQNILVYLSGKSAAEQCLPVSSELARAFNARLTLVCVAGPDFQMEMELTGDDLQQIAEKYGGIREEEHLLSTNPRMVEQAQGQIRMIAQAEAYVTALANRLAASGLMVEIAVPFGKAIEGVLTEIELRHADLLIATNEPPSGISHLIHRSIIAGLLEKVAIPVLVIPFVEPV